MGIICDTCGRDIDALGQDNMGVDAPLCEDCWGEQQGHAAAVLKHENASLSGEVRKHAMHKVAEPMLRMAVE